jgi:hypothetical protein
MNKYILIALVMQSLCSCSSESSFQEECDPNYSGTCIPVSYSDLDCTHIGAKSFRVIGSDKHKFDRDKDKIACEPYPY